MKYKALIVFLYSFSLVYATGQTKGYYIQFTNKAHSDYSIDKPEEFLSQRAIDRRLRQNIAINEEDLPVSEFYIDSLRKLNIDIRYTTKWLNGAIAFSANQELMDTLGRLSFISAVEMTWESEPAGNIQKFNEEAIAVKAASDEAEYGLAWDQIRTVNGQLLHDQGYKGEGIHIAVMDGGFYLADYLPAFQHLWDNGQILGTKDFVDPQSDIFDEHYHGMKVLSIMGGQIDGSYMGTAPEAGYWLFRTEDVYSETPIEPDYWVCAVEFADSAGVDVINTSLGYYYFDPPFTSYTYEDLNGTTRASRAATIAASKGMVVVVSAGNEGNTSWHYIGVPADARNIISVAAMNVDSVRASFSSYGPTYDGRVKPDVAALGYKTAVQSTSGGIELGNGTSYSAPVIAGMMACTWQALPDFTANGLIDLVLENSNQYLNPDDSFGYGIPDFNTAVKTDMIELDEERNDWLVFPNPFSDFLIIHNQSPLKGIGKVSVSVYDMLGNRARHEVFVDKEKMEIQDMGTLPGGLYIVLIESDLGQQYFKLLKK